MELSTYSRRVCIRLAIPKFSPSRKDRWRMLPPPKCGGMPWKLSNFSRNSAEKANWATQYCGSTARFCPAGVCLMRKHCSKDPKDWIFPDSRPDGNFPHASITVQSISREFSQSLNFRWITHFRKPTFRCCWFPLAGCSDRQSTSHRLSAGDLFDFDPTSAPHQSHLWKFFERNSFQKADLPHFHSKGRTAR